MNARQVTLIQYWLYFIALLVFCMVLLGGLTRLTDSGLSITEWLPIMGAIPPLSQADWLAAFAKYKLTTEYQVENLGMSLTEFQFIYWWEWGHRFLGRFVGICYILPFFYFAVTHSIPKSMYRVLVILLILGGVQGFIGWWMVKSGLTGRVDVSQYRLAVHFTMACLIFILCIWAARGLSEKVHDVPRQGSFGIKLLLGLVFVQLFLGALVAGLHAGKVYNTWPFMDGALIPDNLYQYAPSNWLSLFEDHLTVQFNHRLMAYLILITAVVHLWQVRHLTGNARHIVAFARMIVVMTLMQSLLGILTLLFVVPLSLALVHQIFAFVLLSAIVVQAHHYFGKSYI